MKKKKEDPINDFDVMARMVDARGDIAAFPDVLDMRSTKKGANVRVGMTNEAMQKLARSYTEVGPKYVGLFLLVNHEEFLSMERKLKEGS